MTKSQRYLEKAIATASFISAVALAFTSLLISPDHDIAANAMFTTAQFLTLTATILGIDYKFTTTKNGRQQEENPQPLD